MTLSNKTASLDDVRQWAITAAQAADDKKATDTVILQVSSLLGITDAFVIASGSNDRQVKAIVEEVEARVKAVGGPAPRRIEGLAEAAWVLMDYSDFVVHIFTEETREFYNLERLWSDAPQLEWQSTSEAASN